MVASLQDADFWGGEDVLSPHTAFWDILRYAIKRATGSFFMRGY